MIREISFEEEARQASNGMSSQTRTASLKASSSPPHPVQREQSNPVGQEESSSKKKLHPARTDKKHSVQGS